MKERRKTADELEIWASLDLCDAASLGSLAMAILALTEVALDFQEVLDSVGLVPSTYCSPSGCHRLDLLK